MISVIIPVYNVEQYLEKCVESVINQTYQDLEIILVDDGSLDSSGKLCDKLLEVDGRIHVIHKKNGGLSSARNAGIDVAKGEYIFFVDSDDYIDQQLLKTMIDVSVRDNIDIVVCGISYVDEFDNNLKNIVIDEDTLLEGNNIWDFYYNSNKSELVTVAWNKLYKKYIFDNIRYDEGKIYEDVFLLHKILNKCKNMKIINILGNYYVQRSGSITSDKLKYRDLLEARFLRVEYFISNNLFNYVIKELNICRYYLLLFYKESRFDDDKKKNYHIFKQQYFRLIKKSNIFDIKFAISNFIYLYFERLYAFLIRRRIK